MDFTPPSIEKQIESIFRITTSGISHMKKRPVRISGHDIKIWLELPIACSKHVMQAHFLVANAQVDSIFSHFKTQPIYTVHGSRVTYSFDSWDQVQMFLGRLPKRLPSNMITEICDESGSLCSLFDFFSVIDQDYGHFNVRSIPMSSMQKLQRELRSIGLSA